MSQVGRIQYQFNNYCSRCRIKYPKDVLRCECGKPLRVKPACMYGKRRTIEVHRY